MARLFVLGDEAYSSYVSPHVPIQKCLINLGNLHLVIWQVKYCFQGMAASFSVKVNINEMGTRPNKVGPQSCGESGYLSIKRSWVQILQTFFSRMVGSSYVNCVITQKNELRMQEKSYKSGVNFMKQNFRGKQS